MGLAQDVKKRIEGDTKALDNKPRKQPSSKKKPAEITKSSLRRLVNSLTAEQKDWLSDIVNGWDSGEEEEETEEETDNA
jgi:hypothetical protein